MDLPEATENWNAFKQHLESQGIHVFCISAMNRQGTHGVVLASYELLQKQLKARKEVEGCAFCCVHYAPFIVLS